MFYQSRHTLRKYAAAGAIALGAMLTANSPAWADDAQVAQVAPGPMAPWPGKPEAQVHIPGCVAQTITFDSGSAWNLCVKAMPKFGLIISHASFRKTETSPFITVLFDGRLGEIFVPYHVGQPRFHDIGTNRGFDALPLGAGDCPFPRALIDGNKICRDIRDSGIAWKIDLFGVHKVRRGQEVVYFAVLNAFNYDYIMEWSFRDDGTIASRIGSTGPQLPSRPQIGHMHNLTWRLDIDLNGSNGNSACLSRHLENLAVTPSTATDDCVPIRTEAGLDWNAFQFNTLKITHPGQPGRLTNGRGRLTEYELVPYRTGTARHKGSATGGECSSSGGLRCEDFVNHDFWVTRFAGSNSEIFADRLPDYVATGPHDTVNQNLVIWYTGSAHHENDERDEKGGTTPTIWTGFELVPQNLYDSTPFF